MAQPLPGSGINADLRIVSDWGSGYVAEIKVTNTGTTPTASWRVRVAMNQSYIVGPPWRAMYQQQENQVLFAPEPYDAVIAPGASELFGFQAATTGPQHQPVIVDVQRIDDNAGTGGTSGIGGAAGSGGTSISGGTTGNGGSFGLGGAQDFGGSSTNGGSSGFGGESIGGTPEEPELFELSVTIPVDVALRNVVLGAKGTLTVGDYAEVPPNFGATSWPLCVNAEDGTTRLDADAYVGNLDAVGSVTTRNRTNIPGRLRAPTLDRQIDSSVPYWLPVVPTMRTFTRTVAVPPLPEGFMTLEQGQSVNLVPGAWPNVGVHTGATLRLVSGRYFFQSLSFEPGSTLRVDGSSDAVFVYVMDDFVFRGTELRETAETDLLVGVLGDRQVVIERPFTGAIIAPRAHLILAEVGEAIHVGQFFARQIEVRSHARVQLEPFDSGIWDDGDECAWGAPPDSACSYDVACPGASSRRCHDNTCTCFLGPGGGTPDDQANGCISISEDDQGRLIAVNKADGTPCVPAFGCQGDATCDGYGYCTCSTYEPGNETECTEPDPSRPGTLRPVTDGTPCASYQGTCQVATTCARGLCSCSEPTYPSDVNPDCLQDRVAHCVDWDCLDGHCDANGACGCEPGPYYGNGTPIRVGTQNVQALPGFSTELAGCEDFGCKAREFAKKIKKSNYDVLMLNETFEEDDFRDTIVDELYDGGNGPFPYVARKLYTDTGMTDFRQDSGLMLFSRWPFDTRDEQDADCFGGASTVSVLGEGTYALEEGLLSPLLGPQLTAAVYFREFGNGVGADQFASKGVGYARVVTPYGKKMSVFFTHLQAHDQAVDNYLWDALGLMDEWSNPRKYGYTEPVRNAQVESINDAIQCIYANRDPDDELFVLGGDLNVNGDLSNPVAQGSIEDRFLHFLDPSIEFDPAWSEPTETRNEWDEHFNSSGPNAAPDLDAADLRDAWAFNMTRKCVPESGTRWPATGCTVNNLDPLYEERAELYQGGRVTFDRGATAGISAGSEERLDYLFLGTMAKVQHVSRAYNLRKGESGPSGFTRAGSLAPAGGDPISDHMGLNAEIDGFELYMDPASAYGVPDTDEIGEIDMHLPYRTAVHWFKVTKPGDYVFSVNPRDEFRNGVHGLDNGLTFQVFDNTELSAPIHGYKKETITVPPHKLCEDGQENRVCRWTPSYKQARFVSPNFPLWVKVFAEDPAKLERSQGRYVFYFHRATCATPEEACVLSPYATLLGDEGGDAKMTTARTELHAGADAWFKIRLERPDSSELQNIRIFAAEPAAKELIDAVELIDPETMLPVENGPAFGTAVRALDNPVAEWRVWSHTGAYRGEIGGTSGGVAGSAEGTPYYLHLVRAPSENYGTTDEILVGWSTSLTWVYGPTFGRKDSCMLACKTSQEYGHDEIYMFLVDTFDPNLVCAWPSGEQEAKAGIKIDDFEDDDAREWTSRFFAGMPSGLKHPDGTSFQQLPALGFTGDLKVEVWEDDSENDEHESHTYSQEDFPRKPGFIFGDGADGTSSATLTYETAWYDPEPDGKYKLTPCNFAHELVTAVCSSNADCGGEPYLCQDGNCISH